MLSEVSLISLQKESHKQQSEGISLETQPHVVLGGFLNKFISLLFIFGCVGSSLLHAGFL